MTVVLIRAEGIELCNLLLEGCKMVCDILLEIIAALACDVTFV
jgi:hypothetical protein